MYSSMYSSLYESALNWGDGVTGTVQKQMHG